MYFLSVDKTKVSFDGLLKELDAAGIEFKTLTEGRDHLTADIVTEGLDKRIENSILELGDRYETKITRQSGHAESLGAESRAGARREFNKIIEEKEEPLADSGRDQRRRSDSDHGSTSRKQKVTPPKNQPPDSNPETISKREPLNPGDQFRLPIQRDSSVVSPISSDPANLNRLADHIKKRRAARSRRNRGTNNK